MTEIDAGVHQGDNFPLGRRGEIEEFMTVKAAEADRPRALWRDIILSPATCLVLASSLLYGAGIFYWDAFLGSAGLSIGNLTSDRALVIIYGMLIVLRSGPAIGILAGSVLLAILIAVACEYIRGRLERRDPANMAKAARESAAIMIPFVLLLSSLLLPSIALDIGRADYVKMQRSVEHEGRDYVTKTGPLHGIPLFGDHERVWIETKGRLVPVRLDDLNAIADDVPAAGKPDAGTSVSTIDHSAERTKTQNAQSGATKPVKMQRGPRS